MILVDSSVWIANLRDSASPAVAKLRALDLDRQQIIVGDLSLMEVLMGARDEAHAARIERAMQRFPIVPLIDAALAAEAARNFRVLRQFGITIRHGVALVIGTYCIRYGHRLLHDERDFVPMQEHLGLAVL